MSTLLRCEKEPGLFSRAPGDNDPEAVDDYYGLSAGLVAAQFPRAAQRIVSYGWKHFGSFNNANPGKWSWSTFLWRQPQLMVAEYAAALKMPLWQLPFRVYTALVIATSGMFVTTSDTTNRRLNWLLIQSTKKSWLCRSASKVWWWRLKKQYGDGGMREVNLTYFGSPSHPLVKYAVNEWEMK
jgi:hypothetical protein